MSDQTPVAKIVLYGWYSNAQRRLAGFQMYRTPQGAIVQTTGVLHSESDKSLFPDAERVGPVVELVSVHNSAWDKLPMRVLLVVGSVM